MDNSHVEIKPQLKSRGSVAKEEDPKPSTSCTSCRLNPHDQLGRLCVYGIYKRTVRALTKESTLVLIAVDIGGKNTQKSLAFLYTNNEKKKEKLRKQFHSPLQQKE